MKNFWSAPLLKPIITDYPITHFLKEIQPNKPLKIQEASDEFFVLNKAQGLSLFKISTGMGGGGFLLLCILEYLGDSTIDFLDNLLITSPFFIIGLFHLAVYYYNPDKELVLDRVNGTISYPRLFFSKVQVTIPFHLLKAYISAKGGADFDVTGTRLMIKDRLEGFTWSLAESDPEEYWSFLVWYMDKNRPLPIGDAFDPYRDRDYERRKALGFPEPLYESYVPTDEFTDDQQYERRRVAGW